MPRTRPITADAAQPTGPKLTTPLCCVIALSALTLPQAGISDNGSGEQTFEGEASLSAVASRGNADATSVSGELDLLWDGPRHREMVMLKALNSSEDGETNAERYFGSAQADLNLTTRSYIFALGDYEADRFSGYHYRANLGGGYGYQLVQTDAHRLDLEAGPGLRVSDAREDGVEDGTEATFRIAARHRWHVSETSTIRQAVSSVYGEDAQVSRYDLSLISEIVGSLSLKLAYAVRHVSDTPPDVESTDQTLTAGIAYGF